MTFAKRIFVNLSAIPSKNRTFGVEKREKVLFLPLFFLQAQLNRTFFIISYYFLTKPAAQPPNFNLKASSASDHTPHTSKGTQ